MRKLIVTRSDETQKMSEITHPTIKQYADKCKADFMILSDDLGLRSTHYRILKLYDLFSKYDRIVSIDTDALVLKRTPDIFEHVPFYAIGSILEDKGTRQDDRRNRIQAIQNRFKDVKWKTGYINTGFIIFSKCHKDIFKYSQDKLWYNLGYDDVYLGYMIHKLGFDVLELEPKWNFMSMFSEDWCGLSKSDAYVIHYAGRGHYPTIDRVEQIRQDYFILKKYNLI